jgi:hypothetical protein
VAKNPLAWHQPRKSKPNRSKNNGLYTVALSGLDAADWIGGFTGGGEQFDGALFMLGGDDDDHADTAIEYSVHFRIGNAALLLQPLEQGRHRPLLAIKDGSDAVGQHARHVFDKPATGMWAMPLTGSASISASSGLT